MATAWQRAFAMATFCAWHVRRTAALTSTSPARSRPRASAALQPASAKEALRAWHRSRARATESRALSPLTAMMVSPAFAAGPCAGAVAGLALPGAGVDVPGVIAAEGVAGVVGVVDVPVGDGRGCPFIPGNGWPGLGAGCVAADPASLRRAPPLRPPAPHPA